MRSLRTVLMVCTLAAGLAACSAPGIVAPDAPRFDAGQAPGSDATSTGDTGTPTPTADDAERGGPFTVGSGN